MGATAAEERADTAGATLGDVAHFSTKWYIE
eukprot:COSAG02_NODE_66718_length_254_cov_1.632258_1_plen_30_part_10